MSIKKLLGTPQDDNYESFHGLDRNHKRCDFEMQDLFINSLLDLRINHPDAYKKWSEERMKDYKFSKSNQEQKDRINKEADELYKQMQENRRGVK